MEPIAHWHLFVLHSQVRGSLTTTNGLPPWQRPPTGTSRTSLSHRSTPSITTADFRRHHAQRPTITTTKQQRHNICFPTCAPIHATHVLGLQIKNARHKAQNSGTCMSRLQTNKQTNHGHVPRGWRVLSFPDTLRWVSVSGVLTRTYKNIRSKQPLYSTSNIHPPFCLSFALADKIGYGLASHLMTPSSYHHVRRPTWQYENAIVNVQLAANETCTLKCEPKEANFSTSLYGCVKQCHCKFLSAKYGYPLHKCTQKDKTTLLILVNKNLEIPVSGLIISGLCFTCQ